MTSVTLGNHMIGERKDSGARSWKPRMPSMISVPSTNSVELSILAKANIGCFQAEWCLKRSDLCFRDSRNIEKGG